MQQPRQRYAPRGGGCRALQAREFKAPLAAINGGLAFGGLIGRNNAPGNKAAAQGLPQNAILRRFYKNKDCEQANGNTPAHLPLP
jgi:hypothetical protein